LLAKVWLALRLVWLAIGAVSDSCRRKTSAAVLRRDAPDIADEYRNGDRSSWYAHHFPHVANMVMAAAVITPVANHPKIFSQRERTNSPMIRELMLSSMIMIMIGTAATPLMTRSNRVP